MGEGRRQQILAILKESDRPVTGSELSTRLKVSRQVIVQDIALLRAHGASIVATPQGYMLPRERPVTSHSAVLACQHNWPDTGEELTMLVDCGLKVVDVIVEHPVYGELCGLLMIESRRDVSEFLARIAQSDALLLSALTKGVHLHTVEYSRPESLEAALAALRSRGFLVCE